MILDDQTAGDLENKVRRSCGAWWLYVDAADEAVGTAKARWLDDQGVEWGRLVVSLSNQVTLSRNPCYSKAILQ